MENLLAAAGPGGEQSTWLILMAGIFAIFYFIVFRPQQKKQKQLKKQIENLSKGDRFVTVGGLYVTVMGIKEYTVMAKIADDVKVEIAKSAISAVIEKGQK